MAPAMHSLPLETRTRTHTNMCMRTHACTRRLRGLIRPCRAAAARLGVLLRYYACVRVYGCVRMYACTCVCAVYTHVVCIHVVYAACNCLCPALLAVPLDLMSVCMCVCACAHVYVLCSQSRCQLSRLLARASDVHARTHACSCIRTHAHLLARALAHACACKHAQGRRSCHSA